MATVRPLVASPITGKPEEVQAGDTLVVNSMDAFYGYDSTGGQSFSGVTTIQLDSEFFASSSRFTLNVLTGELTINTPGWYWVSYSLTLVGSNTQRKGAECWLELNGAVLPGTLHDSYQRSNVGTCASASIPLILNTNDVLRVRAEQISGGGNLVTVANKALLSVRSQQGGLVS